MVVLPKDAKKAAGERSRCAIVLKMNGGVVGEEKREREGEERVQRVSQVVFISLNCPLDSSLRDRIPLRDSWLNINIELSTY